MIPLSLHFELIKILSLRLPLQGAFLQRARQLHDSVREGALAMINVSHYTEVSYPLGFMANTNVHLPNHLSIIEC